MVKAYHGLVKDGGVIAVIFTSQVARKDIAQEYEDKYPAKEHECANLYSFGACCFHSYSKSVFKIKMVIFIVVFFFGALPVEEMLEYRVFAFEPLLQGPVHQDSRIFKINKSIANNLDAFKFVAHNEHRNFKRVAKFKQKFVERTCRFRLLYSCCRRRA